MNPTPPLGSQLPDDDPNLIRLHRDIVIAQAEANAQREVREAEAEMERIARRAGLPSLKPQSNGASHPSAPLVFRTAREIATATPERPQWVCEGLTAVSSITELDGPQKRGGKTTFTMHLVRAIITNSPFLGRSTVHTPVVWLTEERHPTFRESLRRADLLDTDLLHILTKQDAYGRPWPEVVDGAAYKAREVGSRLLIVDTLPQFAGIKGDAENSSGDALEAMEPLQRAAASGLAIYVVRHDRRAGGDVGDSGRGSTAFTGAVDIVLRLVRLGDGRETMRELSGIGRYDEIPEKLIVELTDDGYQVLGTEADVKMRAAKDALMSELPDTEEDAIGLSSLTKEGGPLYGKGISPRTYRNAVEALETENRVKRLRITTRDHKWYVCRPIGPSAHVHMQPFPAQSEEVGVQTPHVVNKGGLYTSRRAPCPPLDGESPRKLCPDDHVCSLMTPTGSAFCCGRPEED